MCEWFMKTEGVGAAASAKGSTYDEIRELKRKLLVQFRKTPEDTRVQTAKLAINELIRMHGL